MSAISRSSASTIPSCSTAFRGTKRVLLYLGHIVTVKSSAPTIVKLLTDVNTEGASERASVGVGGFPFCKEFLIFYPWNFPTTVLLFLSLSLQRRASRTKEDEKLLELTKNGKIQETLLNSWPGPTLTASAVRNAGNCACLRLLLLRKSN